MPLKKDQVLKQFIELKTKIINSKSIPKLHTVVYSTIDLATKHTPNLFSIIEGLKQIPTTQPPRYTHSMLANFMQLNDDRDKALHLLTEIIDYLNKNDIDKPVRKSTLEAVLDVKALMAALISLLAIIVTLVVVGLPNASKAGYENGKSNAEAAKQREVDFLYNKIDSLKMKITELQNSTVRNEK